MRRFAWLVVLSVLCCTAAAIAQDDDLNIYMMQATVKLQGRNSLGTGFMLMRPLKTQTGPAGIISGKIVLITAAHVLEEIPEDEITVVMHSHTPSGEWTRHEVRLQIRRNGQALWKRHREADVAVMYVLPDISPFDKAPPTDLLASDEVLRMNDMAPGINLKCLGYPLGFESNASGFGILRTGDIASYPLLPSAQTKTFLMDFRVFKGNSGGPVYFTQPQWRGGIKLGGRAQFIMGLISKEALFPIQNADPYGASVRELQLMLGVVVHASIIRETIELLPLPEDPESNVQTIRMRLP